MIYYLLYLLPSGEELISHQILFSIPLYNVSIQIICLDRMHNSCLDMVKGMVKGRQKVKRKLRKERKDDPPLPNSTTGCRWILYYRYNIIIVLFFMFGWFLQKLYFIWEKTFVGLIYTPSPVCTYYFKNWLDYIIFIIIG